MSSTYAEAAGALRRAAAAPEREHRRLLAARARGARPAARRRDRVLPAVRGRDAGVRAVPRRRRRSPGADQRPRRRHHGARGRVPPAAGRRADSGSDRPGAGVRDLSRRHRRRRRPPRAGDAQARLQFRARRGARGDHAADTRGLPHEPEQPDRRVDAARRDSARSRGACPGRRSCSSTRRTPSSPASRSSRSCPRFRTSSSAGRSRRPSASPACASAASSARRRRSIRSARRSRSTASTSPRSSRCRRRSRIAHTSSDYLRQVEESKALLYAACDRLGLKYWKSDANFVLVCAGDRLHALVKGAAERGIYLRDRSTEPGCAGCLRIATGHRRAHTPLHRGDGRGPVRRAVIDRRTTETQIALTLGLDGKGRYDVRTGIRFLDHMLELFARHGAFDLRIEADGDLDVDQHHTVEDLGHRARRGGVEGARRPARHQPRRLLRDADGRDAGRRGRRSRRTAARGRRPARSRVARVGDLQTELVHDFFEGFAIGARANVHVKVLYGRSSHHTIEAVFKAFARALRVACAKDKRLARMLPSTKGLL